MNSASKWITAGAQAFGSDLSDEELQELFTRADADRNDVVDENELATCLAAWGEANQGAGPLPG